MRDLLEGEGRRAVLFPGDISDEQYCKDLVQKAVDELGGLDTLVMVAGRMDSNEDILTLDTPMYRLDLQDQHLLAVLADKAAVPHLEPGSTIVTTGSIQASTAVARQDRLRRVEGRDQALHRRPSPSSSRRRGSA